MSAARCDSNGCQRLVQTRPFVQDIHYQAPVVLGGGTGRLIRHFVSMAALATGDHAGLHANKTLHAKTLNIR